MATNIDDLVQKSKDNEKKNQKKLAESFLYYDEGFVNARKSLGGNLDLTDKANREKLSKNLVDELYKTGAKSFAEEMGLNFDDSTKSIDEVSNATKATVLSEKYALDPEQLQNLISESKDINQVRGYLQGEKTSQNMVQKLMSRYVMDSHEHLKTASEADRKTVVKALKLEKVLDKSGQDFLASESNYKLLGRALYDNKKLNGLNAEYFNSSEQFRPFVIKKDD